MSNTAKGPRPCTCSLFEEIVNDGTEEQNFEDFQTVGTGCTAQVTGNSEFKQGHDAKLKSLLIRAGRASHMVRRMEGGMPVDGSAANMAQGFGFYHQVIAGIEGKGKGKGKGKSAASAPSLLGRKARIKVGRWTYEGIVSATTVNNEGNETADSEPVEFQYETKNGETKTVSNSKVGHYVLV